VAESNPMGEPGPASRDRPPRSSLRRRRAARWAKALGPVLVTLLVALALNGPLTLLSPQYGVWTDALTSTWGNVTYAISALHEPVYVLRDGAGTVHIFAADDADLFYAQGFTQASDRLFQMEVQSLAAQGNLSQWIGPSALASDYAYRYLGIPSAAAEIARDLPTVAPWAAADLEDFSAGVNAYIAYAEAHNELPLPFKALGVRPFSWSPYATLCFERLMVLSQTTGITEPLVAAITAAGLGDNLTNTLYPIYPADWQNFTVLPGNGSLGGESLTTLQNVTPAEVFGQDWFASWATGISPSSEKSLVPLYRAALANLSDPYLFGLGAASTSQGVGSNSWVVAGNRTGMGLPLLANDPHLPLQLPSLWVPTQLGDPNYDVAGWALAGAPGILIGHDPSLAWGLTNSGGATALDYVELLNGSRYLYDGSWHPLQYQNQTLTVAGSSPVFLSVPWTNNGPVVARIGSYGLSVRWDGSGPTYELLAELLLDRAVSISQATTLLESNWDIPNLNFLMAEYNRSSGATRIGYVLPAHFPLVLVHLPDGAAVRVIGSRAPMNGTGAYEPVGTIPSPLSPQVIDPAQGYLYAPNQPPVGMDFPYPFIGGWWVSGGRAHTIGTFLREHPTVNVTEMMALQANVTDSWALLLKPVVLRAFQTVAQMGDNSTAGLASAALPFLEDWNGSFLTGEVAPTLYTYWWNAFLQDTWQPTANSLNIPGGLPVTDPNEVLTLATQDPSSSWFPGGWSTVTIQAAVGALNFLERHFGSGGSSLPDLSGWTWGRVHTFFLPSILGYRSFGMGPYPQWGDSYTPSVGKFTPALTIPLTQVAIGSSLRMVTVPASGPSWGIIPGGASGNVASVYYANQLPDWLDHQYMGLDAVSSVSGPFYGGVVSEWVLDP
jgi:penicillin amidase